ncbi:MAG: dihydropyrimidinase [Bacteroidales bacterium]
MNILIQNATVVTSSRTFKSDILIAEGKIKAVKESISAKNQDKIIDATGKYLFPGGVDPHVHFNLPTPAGFSADNFLSGSKAALFGGTTTIIDFVTPNKGQSLIEALEHRIEEAKESLIDFSFHISPVEWRDTTADEIKECVKRGFPSFKIYMAYKASIGLNDNAILKVMQAVARAGGMVTVHAEMGDEIEQLRDKFFAEGKTEPLYHPLSRPPRTESEAVRRVIEMADRTSCPLYIVHVSAKESIEHIRKAQAANQKVFAETCPHFLVLNDSAYKGSFLETAKYVLSPPIRKQEDCQALWTAMNDGTIQTIGTDHCPFTQKQKDFGRDDFRKIPNGAGGVEHRMALLYTYGVLEKRINLNQFVNLTSTQAAKIFGLYPQKGEITVGSDADIVLWNPNKEERISAKTHHSNCDISIYEGVKTFGAAETIFMQDRTLLLNRKGNSLLPYHYGKLITRESPPFYNPN